MLYEKPMWVWKIPQYKSIFVYLYNGIMISGNGQDMGPLNGCKNIFRFKKMYKEKQMWKYEDLRQPLLLKVHKIVVLTFDCVFGNVTVSIWKQLWLTYHWFTFN